MKAIYTRVSSTEQTQGTSLEDQERTCRGASLMLSAVEPEVFCDAGVSGSMPLALRPAGQRLWTKLDRGDTLIVAKLDRAFRNSVDALQTLDTLKARGVSVIITNLGSDPVTSEGISRFVFTMLAALAEFERFQIAERLAAGRAGKKARGGHIGGEAPFGWRIEGSGRDSHLVPDETEQEVIRIAQRLKPQKSYRAICNHLEYLGLKARNGTPWHPMRLKRALDRLPEAAE
jgi:DNA invertase Pin-like site-specific DNA recombinase